MVSYCYILPNVGGLVKIDGNKSSVRFQSTKYLIGSGYVILKKNQKKNTGCMKRNDLISMCSLLPFSGNDRNVLLEGICKFQVVGSG